MAEDKTKSPTDMTDDQATALGCLVIILVAGFLIWIVIKLFHSSQPSAPAQTQTSIRNVLSDYHQDEQALGSDPSTDQFADFINQLAQIDASECPADFQMDWNNWMQALEAKLAWMRANTGVAGFVRNFTRGFTFNFGAVANTTSHAETIGDNLNRTWNTMITCARHYGAFK